VTKPTSSSLQTKRTATFDRREDRLDCERGCPPSGGFSRFKDQGQTPDSEIAAIDPVIEDATSVVTVAKGRVIELEAKRLTARQSVIAASDRLKSVGERIKQFVHLRSFYDTDTKQIEATLEAGHAFERLPGGHCCLCGVMPDHATAHAADSIETYEAAARSELAKLERLKTDLDDTLASLRSEQTEQEGEIESLSGFSNK